LVQDSWHAGANPNTASLPLGCLRVSFRFLSRKQPQYLSRLQQMDNSSSVYNHSGPDSQILTDGGFGDIEQGCGQLLDESDAFIRNPNLDPLL